MTIDPVVRNNLQRFANDHKVIFEDAGEVGFGRRWVGFVKGTGYLDLNPYRIERNAKEYDWTYVLGPYDHRLDPPEAVPDAYHKHACLCVLVHNDNDNAALTQLNAWVQYLEAQGPLDVVDYPTGATGVQAVLSGVFAYALRYKEQPQ